MRTVSPIRLTVRVHPKAARVRHVWDGATLELWVHEPPVDGAANSAVIKYVAKWLRIPPRNVSIVSGHTSRTKIIELCNVATLPPAETLL